METFVREILAELTSPPILVSLLGLRRRRLTPVPRVLRRLH